MSVVSFPTTAYTALIADYRKMADNAGLAWDQDLSSTGAVAPAERWNLSAIAGLPGIKRSLSSLGTDAKTLAEINRRRSKRGETSLDASALPRGWQDLVRALVVKHLIAEKKSPGHAVNNVARPTRCLATCCLPKEPWEITAEDLRNALDIIGAVSLKTSENTETVARWMSAERLAHAHPLTGLRKRGRTAYRPSGVTDIRHNLNERSRLNRLPGEKEFWELVRIALDERPGSFYERERCHGSPAQAVRRDRSPQPTLDRFASRDAKRGRRDGWHASLDAMGALPENVSSIHNAGSDAAEHSDSSPNAQPEVMPDEHQRTD